MLDLQPMQIHRDFDFGDQILSVQHAAPLLHVQNLDGENVRGLPQFLVREKKWRGLLLLDAPPFHYSRQPAEFFQAQRTQNAHHVQVRVSFAKIAARRRAKQDHAFQICRCEFSEPFHQFCQLCIHRKHFRLIPVTLPRSRRARRGLPCPSPRPVTSFLTRRRRRCSRRQTRQTLLRRPSHLTRHPTPPPPNCCPARPPSFPSSPTKTHTSRRPPPPGVLPERR